MKILHYFWIPFVLYFIVVHPAILYYSDDAFTFPQEQNPYLALAYLGFAIIGWTVFFTYAAWVIYKQTFGLRKGVLKLSGEGRLIQGNVLETRWEKALKNGFLQKEVLVAFNNLSNTPVEVPILIVDTKAHLKRFEPGRTLALRVDADIKHPPYVVPDGLETKVNGSAVLLACGIWLSALIGLLTYIVYAYRTESQGYGWRFLSLWHPLILSLIILAGALVIGYFLIYRYFMPLFTGNKGKEAIKLLLYGERTTATVVKVYQTGTYINEQPEVKFEMTFTDRKNVTHQVSAKEIVSLLSLQDVHQQKRVILYLPESPTTIAFEEDLEEV